MVFRDGQTKAVGICPKHMYFLMFQDLLLRDQPKVVHSHPPPGTINWEEPWKEKGQRRGERREGQGLAQFVVLNRLEVQQAVDQYTLCAV